MSSIFKKKMMRQGFAFVLICALAFAPVWGLDKSYAEENPQPQEASQEAEATMPETGTEPEAAELAGDEEAAGAEEIAEKAPEAELPPVKAEINKRVVDTPVISKVRRASYNSIEISWEKVPKADGYILYRSARKNGFYRPIEKLKGSNNTDYLDERRTTGKKYFYKVKAYKKVDGKIKRSDFSQIESGKTTPARTKFNKDTVYGYKSVTLNWNKSKGAEGYKIYRSTSKNSGYKLVKTVHNRFREKWTNDGLNAKKTYYYKVAPYTKVKGEVTTGTHSAEYKKATVPKRLDTLTKKYKDVNYVYGGNSPRGWDCSGFTQWSAKYVSGETIPRTASAQAASGRKIDKKNKSEWKPGDVLLYADPSGQVCHSALYVGSGKMMHALNERFGTLIQTVDGYERWDSYTTLKYVKRY